MRGQRASLATSLLTMLRYLQHPNRTNGYEVINYDVFN